MFAPVYHLDCIFTLTPILITLIINKNSKDYSMVMPSMQ